MGFWIRSHKTFVAGVLTFVIGSAVCVSAFDRYIYAYLDSQIFLVRPLVLAGGLGAAVLGAAIALTSVLPSHWIRSHKAAIIGVLTFLIGSAVCVSAFNRYTNAYLDSQILLVRPLVLAGGLGAAVLGAAIALTSVLPSQRRQQRLLTNLRSLFGVRFVVAVALAFVDIIKRRPLIKQMLVTAAVVAVGLVVYWLATGRDCPTTYDTEVRRGRYGLGFLERDPITSVTIKAIEGHRHGILGILGLGKCYWDDGRFLYGVHP
jgi:hypothetical protein